MKIDNIAVQFGLTQVIQEPTHYTESSYFLINIMLISSPHLLSASNVAESFLDQNLRYHCTTFCCLRYDNETPHTYKRKIWKYADGDFNAIRLSF